MILFNNKPVINYFPWTDFSEGYPKDDSKLFFRRIWRKIIDTDPNNINTIYWIISISKFPYINNESDIELIWNQTHQYVSFKGLRFKVNNIEEVLEMILKYMFSDTDQEGIAQYNEYISYYEYSCVFDSLNLHLEDNEKSLIQLYYNNSNLYIGNFKYREDSQHITEHLSLYGIDCVDGKITKQSN